MDDIFLGAEKHHPSGFKKHPAWKMLVDIWVFRKIGVPQNGWFVVENPTKMDDLGVPPFSETPIFK